MCDGRGLKPPEGLEPSGGFLRKVKYFLRES